MPTPRVGRFAQKHIHENEIAEELEIMKPATTKGNKQVNTSPLPPSQDELSEIDFMTSPSTPPPPVTRTNNSALNKQSNAAFNRPMMNKISDVVSKEDLAGELLGFNKIEGIEYVYVSVRFGKGDKYEPDRKVAYITAYNPLDNEDVTLVTSAWQAVRQLEVAEAKNSFPFLATAVLVSTDGKPEHWELQ